MSQPVKLSDELVLDARTAGEALQRSIAGQVEYWSRLGREVDSILQGSDAMRIARRAAPRPLSECLAMVGTPEGHRRLEAYLESQPFPHYKAHPAEKGLLIRTEENGTTTIGRFVNRKFEAVQISASKRPAKQALKKEPRVMAGATR